jgi:hypothetical protein
MRIADPGIAFFTGYDQWVAVEVTQRIGGLWLAPMSRPKSDENKVERKATTTSVFKQSVARQACNS